jgi:hypothetical protein
MSLGLEKSNFMSASKKPYKISVKDENNTHCIKSGKKSICKDHRKNFKNIAFILLKDEEIIDTLIMGICSLTSKEAF